MLNLGELNNSRNRHKDWQSKRRHIAKTTLIGANENYGRPYVVVDFFARCEDCRFSDFRLVDSSYNF